MHTQRNTDSKKISEKLSYEVCSYIRAGAPTQTAAIAAGIDKRDYLLWMREGESPHHYEGCEDCDFALFFKQITIAKAQTIVLFFATITRAAVNGDWKASVWWLEKYANLEEEENIKVDHVPTLEELNKLVDKIMAMRRSKNY